MATKGMRVSWLPNGRDENRIVVIPARGFGTAVERNLCRRHGKEAYRALKTELVTGYDIAVLCYPGAYSFAERRNQLSSLLRKANLFRDQQPGAADPAATSSKET